MITRVAWFTDDCEYYCVEYAKDFKIFGFVISRTWYRTKDVYIRHSVEDLCDLYSTILFTSLAAATQFAKDCETDGFYSAFREKEMLKYNEHIRKIRKDKIEKRGNIPISGS